MQILKRGEHDRIERGPQVAFVVRAGRGKDHHAFRRLGARWHVGARGRDSATVSRGRTQASRNKGCNLVREPLTAIPLAKTPAGRLPEAATRDLRARFLYRETPRLASP